MGMYGYGVYSGFGYNPVQNYGYFPNNMGLYGYPGQACSSGCNCLGGSYYVQGSCSCQVGYIISGQTCVPQPIVTQPAPISYSNCPTGFYFIGYTCAPYYIPQPQPQPQPQPVTYQCSTPCSGGAVCNYGSCSCPQSLVMYSGSCFTQQVYPGSACNPVQTCLGGSYCSYGSCACQSGYTVAGNSCVLVYQPAQYYTIPTQQISTYTSYTCTSSSQCGTGAICGFGACRCTSINYYYQTGVGCVFRSELYSYKSTNFIYLNHLKFKEKYNASLQLIRNQLQPYL